MLRALLARPAARGLVCASMLLAAACPPPPATGPAPQPPPTGACKRDAGVLQQIGGDPAPRLPRKWMELHQTTGMDDLIWEGRVCVALDGHVERVDTTRSTGYVELDQEMAVTLGKWAFCAYEGEPRCKAVRLRWNTWTGEVIP